MKDQDKKNQSQSQSQTQAKATPSHTTGDILYGMITDVSPTPNGGMQQLIHWDLDPSLSYQQQKSDDKGATWVAIGDLSDVESHEGGLQIPGGVPVRLVVK